MLLPIATFVFATYLIISPSPPNFTVSLVFETGKALTRTDYFDSLRQLESDSTASYLIQNYFEEADEPSCRNGSTTGIRVLPPKGSSPGTLSIFAFSTDTKTTSECLDYLHNRFNSHQLTLFQDYKSYSSKVIFIPGYTLGGIATSSFNYYNSTKFLPVLITLSLLSLLMTSFLYFLIVKIFNK